MASRLKDGEIYAGLALAGLGTFIAAEASKWSYYSPDGPGPGFFPLWYGLLILALSLLLIVGRIVRPLEAPDRPTDWLGVARALGTWAALVAAIAAMKPAGFLISFTCLTFLLVLVVFRKSILLALITAVALSAGFYLLFKLALGVDLPAGPLGF